MAQQAKWHSARVRGLLFFGLWLILMPSLKWYDLLFGLGASLMATWVSLHLLPPSLGQLDLLAWLKLLPRFLLLSVSAGWDVMRRVFSPDLPIKPGLVAYPVKLPQGLPRNVFSSVTSLMPGSLPVDDSKAGLVYHVLDTDQPLQKSLQEEERLLSQTLKLHTRQGASGE